MTQVSPAESQLLCHEGREGTAKWNLSPVPPGWDAGTLQLEIRKTRTLACTQWVLPISTKMPACMGSFLWEHCSLYSQGLTSGANQRTFLNKFCYIESMNEKWFVLNVITIQLHLDAKYRFSNVILNWTYHNVLSPFQQIFNTKT